MSAKYQVETLFAERLKLLLPELNVPVIAGHSDATRPKDFVTVNCSDEEPRGPRGWLVDCRIISVAELDDVGGLAASVARLRLLSRFFGESCPLLRVAVPDLYIAGIVPQRTSTETKTRSRGEVLPLTVLATVGG